MLCDLVCVTWPTLSTPSLRPRAAVCPSQWRWWVWAHLPPWGCGAVSQQQGTLSHMQNRSIRLFYKMQSHAFTLKRNGVVFVVHMLYLSNASKPNKASEFYIVTCGWGQFESACFQPFLNQFLHHFLCSLYYVIIWYTYYHSNFWGG